MGHWKTQPAPWGLPCPVGFREANDSHKAIASLSHTPVYLTHMSAWEDTSFTQGILENAPEGNKPEKIRHRKREENKKTKK